MHKTRTSAERWFRMSVTFSSYGNKKRRKPRSHGDWTYSRRYAFDPWPDNRRKLRDKIHTQEMRDYDL